MSEITTIDKHTTNLSDGVVLDHELETNDISNLGSDIRRIIIKLIRPSDNNGVDLWGDSSGRCRARVRGISGGHSLSTRNSHGCGDGNYLGVSSRYCNAASRRGGRCSRITGRCCLERCEVGARIDWMK